MSDKLYNIINKLQRWLPAVGVFYLTVSMIWGLPFGDQINETIIAIATLLAATLEIATVAYHKSQMAASIKEMAEDDDLAE